MAKLRGKTVIVTGANQGIGREVASDLAGQGATVVLACRNLDNARNCAADIREAHPEADVVVGPALDLARPDSIRQFAEAFQHQQRPLHILVNNAGANYLPESYTDEGVGILCQVNYLGPYHLTRLLEPQLLSSAPSRVVNVSSIMHRSGTVHGDVNSFLRDWNKGSQYSNTKLANVLFTYEAQRRLGPRGVQTLEERCLPTSMPTLFFNPFCMNQLSCAVDPGAVSSNIYANSRLPSPIRWFIRNLHAPTQDGAQAVIHAATTPWRPVTTPPGQPHTPQSSELRFYARGAFASPAIGWCSSDAKGLLGHLQKAAWAVSAVVHSSLDWPVRRLSGGRLLSATHQVPSHPASYDTKLASNLWNASAGLCHVSKDIST